ncbi:MAG: hypothetical protein Q7S56_01080 [Nanoarchaeota archaeon]|nr:hypothetical protein [Nanoarchaeota archaeon]
MVGNSDVNDVLRKYGAEIENQIQTDSGSGGNYSNAYVTFKEEMAPELTRYEKWCNSLGSVIKINISKGDADKVQRQLEIAHLDVEPWQALTLAVMSFLGFFFLGFMASIAVALINGGTSIAGIFSAFPYLFFVLSVVFSLFLYYYVSGYPKRLANKWRLKASSQMVPAILYLVVYMRHTANLEKAVAFASEHLEPPLSLDFKKVFYDVEIGRFSTIKESLDNYLETWRDYSTEFIESFHLIESSLYEPDEARRIDTLEKSLQVILDGVYDKMLKFTHDVRSPLTNVYMLGVVLPTLGLALLPLASAMIGDYIKWIHILILFNLIVPFLVFYLVDRVLFMRPGGYGETTLLEQNPYYPSYISKKPYFIAFLICFPLIFLGFLPLIFQYTPFPNWFGLQRDYSFTELGLGFLGNDKLFDFRQVADGYAGPFGIGALLLGMFVPLGIALFFSIAYSEKTKLLIKERDRTKQLEDEFNNSLFQLGNRLGNGVPPELVFGKVAESARGLMTEDFFRKVDYNIRQGGMSVDRAIFDKQRGALIDYPSDLIATSMRILIESSKKGLKIAAISLMSISEYVKNIKKITDRLRDLLAEIISDMKSNMTFLAPLLSGIVVGLASMITAILTKLDLGQFSGSTAFGNLENILQIFQVMKMVPPYYLQIIVGIYLIEIIFILTSALVTIDSGDDKLETTNKTGKNLSVGILIYFVIAMVSTLALYFLSAVVLGGLTG